MPAFAGWDFKHELPSDQSTESLTRLHAELKGKRTRGQRFISAAYIGFDSCMQGPVFARAAKDEANPNSTREIASNEANQTTESKDAFDLEDLAFSCDSASSFVGHGFIPHFALTSLANMGVLRKLLTGHSWRIFFSTLRLASIIVIFECLSSI